MLLSAVTGHAGDGSIDFNLTQPLEMNSQELKGLQAEFNKIVHDIVHRMNGSITAEHGGGQLKSQELKHYMNPVEYQMIKMIKRTFDPENLFNPHKVIKMED